MKAVKFLLAAAFALGVNAAFAQTMPATSTAPGQSNNANDHTSMSTPTMNDGTRTSEPMGEKMSRGKMTKSDGMKHKGMKHKTSMSDGSGKMKTKM